MRMNYFYAVALVALTWCVGTARATESADHRIVDGIAIYFGVLPAELVRGHPREHPESEMHGGVVVGDSHIVVALFDNNTGQRIGGVQIAARVIGEAGGLDVQRPLEAMVIGGSTSYGNYFPMKGSGPFRIELRIRRPGVQQDTQVVFTWARS